MDERILRYTAARTGLGLNYIAKEERISYLLGQLWDIFGDRVILKGGTALNRVHLARMGSARFSEDVDIDFFGDDVGGKVRAIKEGMERVEGFTVEGPRVLHRTFRFDCYYQNPLGVRDRVRAEFYLSGPPYIEANVVLLKSPFVDSYPTMFKVYSFEDLLVKKMVALFNRMEGKDVYDTFHALRLDFNMGRFLTALQKLIEFYRIEGDFFPELLIKLKEARRRAWSIGKSTNHFIPRALRPNWDEIVETLIFRIEEIFC